MWDDEAVYWRGECSICGHAYQFGNPPNGAYLFLEIVSGQPVRGTVRCMNQSLCAERVRANGNSN
jgi:hypothetical protein